MPWTSTRSTSISGHAASLAAARSFSSGRRLQRQGLFPNFRLHRIRRIASVESALMVVGHRFERTVTVSRFGQTGGVQQQKILGAKNLPLDYVDKFVEVQGFICGNGTPKEVGVPVPEHRREQNRSELSRWCSRSGEYQAVVNRSKSPSTERVPLDLFSRAVPDDDVLAVPSSGAQEQRSGSSANGGGAAQSHVCITAIADSDVRFHIQRRCQFTCAVFGDEILDWESFEDRKSTRLN